jgi:hypothetical protein
MLYTQATERSSMKFKSHTLALAAILAAAVVSPAVASAHSSHPPASGSGGANCHIDYSRNSVDGRYCVATPAAAQPAGPREMGIGSVAKAGASAPAKGHDGFSWGDAGVGAGAGAALAVLMLAGTALLIGRRRHETAAPVGGRSATTG